MSDIRDFCPLWGEWEAEEKLGEGSFGAVWKVRRNVLDGKVYYAVVKHISNPKDESEIERLIEEGIFSDESSAVRYGDVNKKNQMGFVAPTAYAIARGALSSDSYSTVDDEDVVCWWLRSGGEYLDGAAGVFFNGILVTSFYVDFSGFVVRPALWVDLKSGIF